MKTKVIVCARAAVLGSFLLLAARPVYCDPAEADPSLLPYRQLPTQPVQPAPPAPQVKPDKPTIDNDKDDKSVGWVVLIVGAAVCLATGICT
jgi:hypothetical protein